MDRLCDEDPLLASLAPERIAVVRWKRATGFASLVQIIAEQSVSLASGEAVFRKLEAATGGVTAETVISFTTDEIRDCGFSRQKAACLHDLSQHLLDGRLELTRLGRLSDEAVSTRLTSVKGIGPWTANIYLLMCLQRPDVFPAGDLAVLKMLKRCFHVEAEEAVQYSERWSPFRSVATQILWHGYLQQQSAK